jgi:hypothetical protein
MYCILRPLHSHSLDHATKTEYPVKAVLTLQRLFQKPKLILWILHLEVHPPWGSRIFYYSGCMMTNHTRCTREIKSWLAMKKAEFNRRTFFYQRIGLKLKKEPSKVLHLEQSFVWCWKLDTSESKSEIPGKFWNVVLENDIQDLLNRLCEKMKYCVEPKRTEISNMQ